ncbi:MAG: TadE family protein [Chloroflexota bacterium]
MVNQSSRQVSRNGQQSEQRERGQSLVELAVIVPILLFIFMGLIEVGWAIRGYLVLLTAGRETARFAARGDSLDFSGLVETDIASDPENVIENTQYYRVVKHANDLLSVNGLGLSLGHDITIADPPTINVNNGDENGAMIITHILVDTGLPCDPLDTATPCDCDQFSPDDANYPNVPGYTEDDLILHPNRRGYEHFQYAAGLTATSRLDLNTVIAELKSENNFLNCNILRRTEALTNNATSTLTSTVGIDFSINSVIIVESFFNQSQVLGAPLISNGLTDPVSLYNNTFMRIATSTNSQGEGCELLPLKVPIIDPNTGLVESYIDEIEYEVAGEWIGWTDQIIADKLTYLAKALINRRLVINEYSVGGDQALNVNDTVVPLGNLNWTAPFDITPGQTVKLTDYLDELKGRVVTVPIVEGTIVRGYVRVIFRDYDPSVPSVTLQGVGDAQSENLGCPTNLNITDWE